MDRFSGGGGGGRSASLHIEAPAECGEFGEVCELADEQCARAIARLAGSGHGQAWVEGCLASLTCVASANT